MLPFNDFLCFCSSNGGNKLKKCACGFIILLLWQLSSSVLEQKATENNNLCSVCFGPEGPTRPIGSCLAKSCLTE